MTAMAGYVIRGGKRGYDRLALLARDRWPDTRALLERAGVGPGMRCVDIGCGGGALTLEMARLVAPTGTVVGIDMDEVKLELARRAAAEVQVVNVAFKAIDVKDWDESGAYDVVYSRFLLQHLSKPAEMIVRMRAAVAPGGVLIAEDADFDGWCCDPPDAGMDLLCDTYRQVLTRWGGDHTTARRLYRMFLAAGLPDPQMTVIQTVHWGEAKMLAWSTLEATADAVIAENLATADQVTAALESLRRLADDPHTLICGPRVFQVWSRC